MKKYFFMTSFLLTLLTASPSLQAMDLLEDKVLAQGALASLKNAEKSFLSQEEINCANSLQIPPAWRKNFLSRQEIKEAKTFIKSKPKTSFTDFLESNPKNRPEYSRHWQTLEEYKNFYMANCFSIDTYAGELALYANTGNIALAYPGLFSPFSKEAYKWVLTYKYIPESKVAPSSFFINNTTAGYKLNGGDIYSYKFNGNNYSVISNRTYYNEICKTYFQEEFVNKWTSVKSIFIRKEH